MAMISLAATALATTNLVLFLLVGQSNMAGRAQPCDPEPLPATFRMNRAGEWTPAISPIHFDKPTAGMGPIESFVHDYHRDHPGEVVGLVPCAVGGSAMKTWSVASNGVRGVNLVRALARAEKAARCGRFAGVLWHQGETDAKRVEQTPLTAEYPRQFESMVTAVRETLKATELPVVIGEIGRFNPDMAAKLNPLLKEVAARTPSCVCVSSEGLGSRDKLHFDKAGVEELGHRYYRAWKELAEQ